MLLVTCCSHLFPTSNMARQWALSILCCPYIHLFLQRALLIYDAIVSNRPPAHLIPCHMWPGMCCSRLISHITHIHIETTVFTHTSHVLCSNIFHNSIIILYAMGWCQCVLNPKPLSRENCLPPRKRLCTRTNKANSRKRKKSKHAWGFVQIEVHKRTSLVFLISRAFYSKTHWFWCMALKAVGLGLHCCLALGVAGLVRL